VQAGSGAGAAVAETKKAAWLVAALMHAEPGDMRGGALRRRGRSARLSRRMRARYHRGGCCWRRRIRLRRARSWMRRWREVVSAVMAGRAAAGDARVWMDRVCAEGAGGFRV
jgi:hypothetical protein